MVWGISASFHGRPWGLICLSSWRKGRKTRCLNRFWTEWTTKLLFFLSQNSFQSQTFIFSALSSRLGVKCCHSECYSVKAISVLCVSWENLSPISSIWHSCPGAVIPTWSPDWPNFLLLAMLPWDKAVAVLYGIYHKSSISLSPHSCPMCFAEMNLQDF